MDTGALQYLLSAAGRDLLGAVDAGYDGSNPLQVSAALRSSYEPAHIAAAMSQVSLRRDAATKFGEDAATMFFTRDALEQATTRDVAQHRAERAVGSGTRSVVDLTCGLGGDLIAFSRAGLAVSGVDRDPLMAAIAAANLQALGLEGRVDVGTAQRQGCASAELVYVDPSRRSARGRVFDPDAYSPPWSFVESLFGRDAVVKAAPGLAHSLVPASVEAEWVSLDGRLREAALWSGRAVSAHRRATVLGTRFGSVSVSDADDPGASEVRPPGRFVYEPDDAVIRAHLVAVVVARVGGWLLDPHLAYASSDERRTGPLWRAFEVVEVLPFREKSLRAALRARDVGALTIKKRGVGVTPEALRSRMRLSGSKAATIIVSRTPTGAVVLLVRPLD